MDLALLLKSDIQAEDQERKRATEGRPRNDEKPEENLPQVSGRATQTRDAVAKLAGVSGRTLESEVEAEAKVRMLAGVPNPVQNSAQGVPTPEQSKTRNQMADIAGVSWKKPNIPTITQHPLTSGVLCGIVTNETAPAGATTPTEAYRNQQDEC